MRGKTTHSNRYLQGVIETNMKTGASVEWNKAKPESYLLEQGLKRTQTIAGVERDNASIFGIVCTGSSQFTEHFWDVWARLTSWGQM